MKDISERGEMDFYRVYLLGHLRDHRFPLYTNASFIEARVSAANETFEEERRKDHAVAIAHEMAMRTLLEGVYVSRYDIIYNVVEENLWTRLPEEYWPDFAMHLLTLREIHDLLDRYGVSGDYLDRETHQPMLTELLGVITEILDGYGL